MTEPPTASLNAALFSLMIAIFSDFTRRVRRTRALPIVTKDTRSIGKLIQGLVLIWELVESDEMRNHVEFL